MSHHGKRLLLALVYLYFGATVGGIAAIWIEYGPIRAWLFGAFACGLPHVIHVHRDGRGGSADERPKKTVSSS